MKLQRRAADSAEKQSDEGGVVFSDHTRTAVHRDTHLGRETQLVTLRIEKVRLKQAKVELIQAEVELKSKVVEYKIKRLALYLAAFGVPGTLAELEWGWVHALTRWISRLIG